MEGRDGAELLGSQDSSSGADLNAGVGTLQGLRLLPVDSTSVIAVVVAAGLPMIPVIMTLIPLDAILKWFFGSLL